MVNNPVVIEHNLDPRKFVFLFTKYASGANPRHHCTNSIVGRYSKKLTKLNRDLMNQRTIILDEYPPDSFKALYICGVSSKGYRRHENYSHNLHVPVLPSEGKEDRLQFEQWTLTVENGLFLPVPSEEDLPAQYRDLPPEYTTCRIFRWAVCFFDSR